MTLMVNAALNCSVELHVFKLCLKRDSDNHVDQQVQLKLNILLELNMLL